MSKLNIANTILEQMGGIGRLSAMINARYFVGGEKSIVFEFSGCRKAKYCKVELLPTDLYELHLYRFKGVEIVTLYKESGLYHDMLKPVFEKQTGLQLSL